MDIPSCIIRFPQELGEKLIRIQGGKTMKNTKRSVLVSGLCLLLTAVMLMGSTFAWFTDSVTNEGNQIQSGTLDISLNNGDETTLFSSENFLFEPGRSQVATATVTNEGSLWLKYTMSFSNVKTTGNSDITDVLDVYTVAAGANDLTDAAYLGTMKSLMTAGSFAAKDKVLAPGASESFTLVIKMQESAGNQYQGCGVAFDVAVVATQYNEETDGFGNPDYDKDAQYPLVEQSGEELQEKLDSMVSGETVTVNPGVTKADVFNIDGDGTFVVQGGTQNPADTVLEGQILFGANSQGAEGKQLTLRNLTISADTIALKFNHSAPGVAAEGLTLVLENCVVEGNGTGSFGALLGTGNRGSKLVLKNVKFVNLDTVLAIADSGNPQDYVSGATGNKVEMTDVTFENCNNQFQLFNPSVFYKDLADVIAKGDVERFNNVFTIDDTQVVPATEDAAANGAALENALTNAEAGDTIVLEKGTYSGELTISQGVTLEGNGATLTDQIQVNADDVTLENIHLAIPVAASETASPIQTNNHDLTLVNCTIERTTNTAQPYGMLVNVGTGVLTAENTVFVAPYDPETAFNASPSVIEAGEVYLDGCRIETDGYGLFSQHATKGLIRNTVFTGIDGRPTLGCLNSTVLNGLVFDGCTFEMGRNSTVAAGNFTMRNCTFDFTNTPADGAGNGINLYAQNGNVVLENNTFQLTAGKTGINLTSASWASGNHDASQVTISGNVFEGTGATAIKIAAAWENEKTVEEYEQSNVTNGNAVVINN